MKIQAYFKIIRPFNCLFIALTVLFGLFFQNHASFTLPFLWGILSATLIGAGGYVINDYFDLPIDRVNRPKRVLPSGQMQPRTAYIYTIVLFVAGLQASFLTGTFLAVFMAMFNLLLLFFYARQLKTSFLLGNLSVAYASASTFVYGGIVAGNLENVWLIAAYAFIYTLIRELVKDLEDIEGDSLIKANTFAIKAGHRTTMALNLALALLLCGVTVYGFLNDLLSTYQVAALGLLVHVPSIVAIAMSLRSASARRYRLLSAWIKIDMVILLLLIWFLP